MPCGLATRGNDRTVALSSESTCRLWNDRYAEEYNLTTFALFVKCRWSTALFTIKPHKGAAETQFRNITYLQLRRCNLFDNHHCVCSWCMHCQYYRTSKKETSQGHISSVEINYHHHPKLKTQGFEPAMEAYILTSRHKSATVKTKRFVYKQTHTFTGNYTAVYNGPKCHASIRGHSVYGVLRY